MWFYRLSVCSNPSMAIYFCRNYFLSHLISILRFYPGIENLILLRLSYTGCHMRATYIGCIGTHAHGCQVTSLLCLSDVIMFIAS